jgi:hypothetical protein
VGRGGAVKKCGNRRGRVGLRGILARLCVGY